MTTSEKCKAVDFKNLKELSEITNKSVRTLQQWNTDNPVFFEIVLYGAVLKKLFMRRTS